MVNIVILLAYKYCILNFSFQRDNDFYAPSNLLKTTNEFRNKMGFKNICLMFLSFFVCLYFFTPFSLLLFFLFWSFFLLSFYSFMLSSHCFFITSFYYSFFPLFWPFFSWPFLLLSLVIPTLPSLFLHYFLLFSLLYLSSILTLFSFSSFLLSFLTLFLHYFLFFSLLYLLSFLTLFSSLFFFKFSFLIVLYF